MGMMDAPKNLFLVGALDDTIIAPGISPRRLTASEAINLAAHLLVHAEHVRHRDGAEPEQPAMFSELVTTLAAALERRDGKDRRS